MDAQTPTQPAVRVMLTLPEVAERLRVSLPTVYRIRQDEDGIKTFKVRGGVRAWAEDVESYLDAQSRKAG